MDKIIIDNGPSLNAFGKELALFFKLYETNFPDVNEREDPQIITDRIRQSTRNVYDPETTIILALSGKKVMGGTVIEYYPECRTFLLTYIVVDNEFRGQGVSRFLVEKGIGSVVDSKGRDQVAAVFFESNIPWMTVTDSFDPWMRFRAFSKLGAKWIDFGYIQPSLGEGRGRVHNLHLLTFPFLTGMKDKIGKKVLTSFLETFYRSLGIQEPAADPDFQEMLRSIEEQAENRTITLKELPQKERDDFRFSDVAVACYFSDSTSGKPVIPKQGNKLSCPVMGSFETDLLLYRYQGNPPFRTFCLTESLEISCSVTFPEFSAFISEGRHETFRADQTPVRLDIKICCSFFNNRHRIWTLVFLPCKGSNITQDEVIKLINLFTVSQENNNIAEAATFDFMERRGISFSQLVKLATDRAASEHKKLFRENPGRLKPIHSGIVHVNTLSSLRVQQNPENMEDVIGLIGKISKNEAGAVPGMENSYRDNPGVQEILNLFCGLTLGILDYTRMSPEEVVDTIRPISGSKDSFKLLNKGILASFCHNGEKPLQTISAIGINPYLLVSGAVLAFNDFLSAEAENSLDKLLDDINDEDKPTPRLNELVKSRKELERILNEEILTNVFHYPTERITLQHGLSHRGILDRVTNISNRLKELISVINDQIERDNKKNKTIVALLLAAISILGLEAFFGRFFASLQEYGGLSAMWEKEGIKWVIFLPVYITLFSVIAYFTIRDLKKKS
jgi:hypothetical protein